jgi:hypothetical protein
MQHKLLLTLLTFAACGIAACGNDNGGDVIDGGIVQMDASTGDGGCRVEPTFTSLHDNLFSTSSCTGAGCHNSMQAGGLDLTGGKAAVLAELTQESTAEAGTGMPNRVLEMDSMNSFLYRKLTDDDPPGAASRMPLGCNFIQPPNCLPQCEVDAVRDWIEAGAMDN